MTPTAGDWWLPVVQGKKILCHQSWARVVIGNWVNQQGLWGAGFIVTRGWRDSWYLQEAVIVWFEYFCSWQGTEACYSGVSRLCASSPWYGGLFGYGTLSEVQLGHSRTSQFPMAGAARNTNCRSDTTLEMMETHLPSWTKKLLVCKLRVIAVIHYLLLLLLSQTRRPFKTRDKIRNVGSIVGAVPSLALFFRKR